MGAKPLNFECFATEEADIEDNHSETVQLQDRSKDHGEELVEINLTGEDS